MIGSLLRIRYEVIQELEEGPIFQSLRVRDRVGGRELKVRLIDAQCAAEPAFLDRIREVISASAAVPHPSLERLLELDDHEGTPFIVSELPLGSQLQEKVRKLAPFSAHVSTGIVAGVCEALSALHDQGMVHGDIDSANVFVTQDGKVKLSLAGMWRPYGVSRHAASAMLPLMAPYIAPEVSQGSMPTASSDIYAAGVLLYELLTGKYPFSADTPSAMAEKHAMAPVPGVRMANPGAPGVIEEIVKKAMAKSPHDRYESAQAMLSDLRVLQDAMRFGRSISWPLPAAGTPAAATPEPEPKLVAPRMSAIRQEPRQEPEQRRSEPVDLSDSLPKWLLFMAYLAVLSLFVFVGGYMYWNLTSPKMVRIPNLVGKNAQQAKADLEKLGLKLRVNEIASDKPQGTVLATDPPGDAKRKEGDSVLAKVSAGRPFVDVPDVLGLDVAEARDLLTKANLKVKEKRVASRDFEMGKVVRQNPRARTSINRGTAVTLYVSSGERGGGGSTVGQRKSYDVSFTLNTDMPVRVRVDMIDDTGTTQIYEMDHSPGDRISFSTDGYGESVIFKIFYDGEFVYQSQPAGDSEPAPAPEART